MRQKVVKYFTIAVIFLFFLICARTRADGFYNRDFVEQVEAINKKDVPDTVKSNLIASALSPLAKNGDLDDKLIQNYLIPLLKNPLLDGRDAQTTAADAIRILIERGKNKGKLLSASVEENLENALAEKLGTVITAEQANGSAELHYIRKYDSARQNAASLLLFLGMNRRGGAGKLSENSLKRISNWINEKNLENNEQKPVTPAQIESLLKAKEGTPEDVILAKRLLDFEGPSFSLPFSRSAVQRLKSLTGDAALQAQLDLLRNGKHTFLDSVKKRVRTTDGKIDRKVLKAVAEGFEKPVLSKNVRVNTQNGAFLNFEKCKEFLALWEELTTDFGPRDFPEGYWERIANRLALMGEVIGQNNNNTWDSPVFGPALAPLASRLNVLALVMKKELRKSGQGKAHNTDELGDHK